MSMVVAGEPVATPSIQDQANESNTLGGAGMSNGDGFLLASGGSPRTAGAAVTTGAPKRRRIIDDDDDDDDPPILAPRAQPSPMATSKPSSGSSKHSSSTGMSGGGGMNGTAKKKIIPGPSKARVTQGATGVMGPRAGNGGTVSSSHKSASKSASSGYKKVYDDEEEEEASFGITPKKTSRDADRGPRGGVGGSTHGIPSKNGVRKDGSSFKIPKRESASPRPVPPSGSPASRTSSVALSSRGSSGHGGNSSSSSSVRKMGHADGNFERKLSKDPSRRRPEDSKRASNDKKFHHVDQARASEHRKRQLEKEERLREEERKKKRPKVPYGKGSTPTTPKTKVKAEPVRRVSSSSASSGKARVPRTAAASAMKPRDTEKKFKEKTRKDRIEEAMKVYKWWEEPSLGHGKQWDSLEHNGAYFAPEYQPHRVKLKYNGEDVNLTPRQEEIATFYASMPLDGPQLKEQGDVFNRNFFEDFKAVLGKGHKIKKFELLDFSAMRRYLETAKQIKRAATDREKAVTKIEKEELKHKYCYAIVDGHLEMVGNFTVEPPGLFRGRGKHPKTGKVKARVMPSDIALNFGESVCVPQCNVPGYAWQHVQHDPSVTWLGKWDGNLAGTKYMMLAASSSFKGKSDMAKYNKAMALKGNIDKIRTDYTKKLNSANAQTKQIATAVWIIDQLALRVGGEKGDDEADTVGCCSLRREHLAFNPDPNVHEIDLEFLGKDSMLFKQTIDFDKYGDVGMRVFNNLKGFCKKKHHSEELFDRLDPSILNQHLQSLMPGLTAKVFRTYNASETLQTQLPEETLRGLSVAEKVALYNGANREVAILCNHQRTVSSAQKEGLEKMQIKLKMLKTQKNELKAMIQQVKQNKRVRMKSADKTAETKYLRAQEKATEAKANAQTDEQKVAAADATAKASELKKAFVQARSEESHLFAKAPTVEGITNRIQTWDTKIKKLKVDLGNKEDNKEVSLSTSKINYMDPRVSVAWCKRHEVPVEKIFAATLQGKFVWAMNVPPDWQFSHLSLPQFQGKAKGKRAPTPAAKPDQKHEQPAAASAKAVASHAVGDARAAPGGSVKAARKKEEAFVKEEEDDDDDESEEDDDDDESDDDDDDDDNGSDDGEEEEEDDDEEEDDKDDGGEDSDFDP